MTTTSPYIKINLVRKKVYETTPDEYYLEAHTHIGGFNSKENIKNDKQLYEIIKFSLELHRIEELNSEIFLKSNIFYLELRKLKPYEENYEEHFEEVGETGLRRLEGKLLSEGYNIKQRIQVISNL